MLIQEGENTYYNYVKRLTALLYDKNRPNERKHFCEGCLYGFQRKELFKRHKPECEGLLNRARRTKLPREGANNVSFTKYYRQMKASFAMYADFESLLRKIQGCEPPKDGSFTVKTCMGHVGFLTQS